MWDSNHRLIGDLIESRRKGLRHEAEQARLAREARQNRQGTPGFYQPFLARLGNWLTAWGLRLQIRYGALGAAQRTYRVVRAGARSHKIITTIITLPEA